MFRIFRKRKTERTTVITVVWKKWSDAIAKKQRIWADRLQKWSDAYSLRSKKIALLVFCVLGFSCSVIVAINALRNKTGTVRVDQIKTIHQP